MKIETKFPHIPTTTHSVKNIKLLCGYGINDATYITQPTVDGKRLRCPYYEKWCSMIKRVYSDKYHERNPTYLNATLCKEWHYFSSFRAWMRTQKWEGMELDKDIMFPENKHYSPKTCLFVSKFLNTLLRYEYMNKSRELPHGVHRTHRKDNYKYRAFIKIRGKMKNLGAYRTTIEASIVYINAKIAEIKRQRDTYIDMRIVDGLNRHIETFKQRI